MSQTRSIIPSHACSPLRRGHRQRIKTQKGWIIIIYDNKTDFQECSITAGKISHPNSNSNNKVQSSKIQHNRSTPKHDHEHSYSLSPRSTLLRLARGSSLTWR